MNYTTIAKVGLLQDWKSLTGEIRQYCVSVNFFLFCDSDLQVFVKVTVRGRPMTNGAHEVTTADELRPWDCNTNSYPQVY